MTTIRKAIGVKAEALGDRQVRVIVATADLDRAGDIVEVGGIDLANFRALRTVLFNHDANLPVAECLAIDLDGAGRLVALVQFPPEGTSAKSDEVHRLIKAGVINAASIGFVPSETEARDGQNPKKGLRFVAGEMTEFSFVSVPANPGARIVERRLPGSGPDEQEETMAGAAPRDAKVAVVKDLYDCGQLASILTSLGWLQSTTAWETEYEGDGSDIPARLAAALTELGRVLVDMTVEEVAELVARYAPGEQDDEAEKAAETPVRKALAAFAKGRKAGARAVAKAGRAISKSNSDALREACAGLMSAHDAVKAIADIGGDDDDDDVEKSTQRDAGAAPLAVTRAARLRREIELLELDAA